MDYCTRQDIIDDFKSLEVNSNAVITEAKLDKMILQESNYINSKLSVRYQVPVLEAESPISYSILTRICTFRVSMRVKNIIETHSNQTQLNSEEKVGNNYARTPDSDLRDIVEGKMLLSDAHLLNQTLGVSSFSAKKKEDERVFHKNLQQW